MKFIDLSGRKMNRLLVISRSKEMKYKKIHWNCLCDCGQKCLVRSDGITRGTTKSCGCHKLEILSTQCNSFKHGRSKSKEYRAWSHMRERCYNKKDKAFKNYGRKGIKVHPRWLESFSLFFEDMGPAPSPKHSIDRINNKGNYEPKNCRWATSKEQNNNYSRNVLLTIDGVTKNLSQWCKIKNINYKKVSTRRYLGWKNEDLFL